MLKDFVSLMIIKLNNYCNLNFRYKTNEKKYEGSPNTLIKLILRIFNI